MTENDLKMGEAILRQIKTTETALQDLEKWMVSCEATHRSRGEGGGYGCDKHYYLTISKHGDSSGFKLDLNRYVGNKELLTLIKSELEKQLSTFKEDFAKL